VEALGGKVWDYFNSGVWDLDYLGGLKGPFNSGILGYFPIYQALKHLLGGSFHGPIWCTRQLNLSLSTLPMTFGATSPTSSPNIS